VNIKKGPFLAPWDVRHVIAKAEAAGAGGVLVTERGTTFGYNNLVVDMRAIPEMQRLGVPVLFDATHSVQLPGGAGERADAQREHAPALARAAIAAGADAVFAEIHEDPDHALSDPASQLPVREIPAILRGWKAVAQAVGRP
jgi:2-dehydro-3-deoxyphosphooctonate aldolase (KDO 8-P synthase)